jgi:hypothetical protein
MSTKIYNGWIVRGTDIVKLLTKLRKFGDEVKKIAAKALEERTAWTIAHKIDSFRMLGEKLSHDKDDSWMPLDVPIWRFVSNSVREDAIKEYTRTERVGFDISCSVVAIPTKWRGTDVTLLMLFDNTPGAIYTEAFKKIVGATDFSYWNNTDPPEDIADAAWDERGKLWNKALPGVGIPAESGFSYTCMVETAIPWIKFAAIKEELAKIKIATRRERIAEHYRSYMGGKLVHAMLKKTRALKKLSASGIFNLMWDWEKSPDGKKMMKKARELAKKRVKPLKTADIEARMTTIAYEVEKTGKKGSR